MVNKEDHSGHLCDAGLLLFRGVGGDKMRRTDFQRYHQWRLSYNPSAPARASSLAVGRSSGSGREDCPVAVSSTNRTPLSQPAAQAL
jgi:hypothetical protein